MVLNITVNDRTIGQVINQPNPDLVAGTASVDLSNSSTYTLEARERIGNLLTVDINTYRGVLLERDSTNANGVAVLVKVALNELSFKQLCDEGYFLARDTLRSFAGHILPRCYGAFQVEQGNEPAEDDPLGCLILQDCGDPLSSFGDERAIEGEFREQLAIAVESLHDAGVDTGYITPEHVHELGGRPFLVGLTATNLDHECQTVEETSFDSPLPGGNRCDAIRTLYIGLNLYAPDHFFISAFGQCFKKEMVHRPMDVADSRPPWMTAKEGLTIAIESICQYLETYNYQEGVIMRKKCAEKLEHWCEKYQRLENLSAASSDEL